MNSAEVGNGVVQGLIFDIQPLSIHDGPGIRTTVFLKGCPLRCEWCSNPESWLGYRELMTRNAKCQRCGRCANACPQKAIVVTRDERKIDWSKCDRCFVCVETCPNEALLISGRTVGADEMADELARDMPFFRNSGGGVTIGGGEPLQQWEFAADLLRRLQAKGIHTAIETTGCASWERMEYVLNHADLLLQDVKHVNPEIHKAQTGVDNKLILDNLTKASHKVRTWVRVPLIPGFNDTDADIMAIAQFAFKLSVEKISLLPYHGYGEGKYAALGRDYPRKGTEAPSDERANELCELVGTIGLKCTVRY